MARNAGNQAISTVQELRRELNQSLQECFLGLSQLFGRTAAGFNRRAMSAVPFATFGTADVDITSADTEGAATDCGRVQHRNGAGLVRAQMRASKVVARSSKSMYEW